MNRKLIFVLAVTLLVFTLPACNALSPQTEPPQIIEPVSTPSQQELLQTEAEVPRVTVEEAKAALNSGEAVIVDVRSSGAYQMSHIAGAIHIPLGEIETDSAGLGLDKDQWILTYCT